MAQLISCSFFVACTLPFSFALAFAPPATGAIVVAGSVPPATGAIVVTGAVPPAAGAVVIAGSPSVLTPPGGLMLQVLRLCLA